MKQQLDYYWRVFATGLCFSVFGLGGVVIGGVVLPGLLLLHRNPHTRQAKAQQLIHRSFAGFVEMMRRVGIMTYEIHGLEKLATSRGEIIVANHPTLVDVVMLISMMSRADCIVKKALWQNPFTRGPVQAAGYILNDDSNRLVDACVQRLQAGDASLIIFPEGTRTVKDQRLNEFQRGAANIAVRSGASFRPVIIRCQPSTLSKNEKWYQVPSRPFHVTIDVREPLPITAIVQESTSSSMAARRVNELLYRYFDEELEKYERSGK